MALENNQQDYFYWLYQNGASACIVNEDQDPLLVIPIKRKQLNILRFLLTREKCFHNMEFLKLAFYTAAYYGNFEALKELKKTQFDCKKHVTAALLSLFSFRKNTAYSEEEILQCLYFMKGMGADLSVKDQAGRTLKKLATEVALGEVVKAL